MDAIELLKADHKQVAKLFRALEREPLHHRKQPIGDRVLAELEVHAQIEEEIFYPAVRERADERDDKMVAEAIEEHRIIKDLVSELKGRSPENPTYDPQFKVLRENVEHHVEEEQDELFPRVRSTMGDELDALGSRLQARKRELQRSTAGTVAETLRGLVNKALDVVSGSGEPKRAAQKTRKAKTVVRRKVAAPLRKTRAAKGKRTAAKVSTSASARNRARSRTAAARKRATAAAKRSVKRARAGRAQTNRKRAAAGKR